jgi:hypothetical protein
MSSILDSGGGQASAGRSRLVASSVGGSFQTGVLTGNGYRLVAGSPLLLEERDPAMAGDFDGDASVDFSDYLLFAAAYGSSSAEPDFDSRFDLDGDGEVGFSDFLSFAQAYGAP